MPEGQKPDGVMMKLSGRRLAILNGASVLLCAWPFETTGAKALARRVSAGEAEGFSDTVGHATRRLFQAAGIWSDDTPWTQELIDRRAELPVQISLSPQEAEVAVVALRASAAEFSDRWWEFCTAAPGALGAYGATPTDLLELADAIESALSG